MDAAKRKALFPAGLAVVRFTLLLVVTLFLPQTRVSGVEAAPQHASGKIAFASASAVGVIAPVLAYDASDCRVAAEELPQLEISASKYPDLAENILNAQQAGNPSVLTAGGDTAANRAAALEGVPNIPGLSRDEYPFASSMEGGQGAWVGHIPVSQQNAQGALSRTSSTRTTLRRECSTKL